ncbi:MAG TPA: hypothetical protein VGE63_03675 [Candidatus Paceibacterota bacterium]
MEYEKIFQMIKLSLGDERIYQKVQKQLAKLIGSYEETIMYEMAGFAMVFIQEQSTEKAFRKELVIEVEDWMANKTIEDSSFTGYLNSDEFAEALYGDIEQKIVGIENEFAEIKEALKDEDVTSRVGNALSKLFLKHGMYESTLKDLFLEQFQNSFSWTGFKASFIELIENGGLDTKKRVLEKIKEGLGDDGEFFAVSYGVIEEEMSYPRLTLQEA